uniref:Metalloendopeptidase n=1 Tax=Saccoglossus kowalevskii TaxID=10224 RepID=A0ABM0LZ16_SACKO|nr:PREDICTED: blastula protease 10-like isoform X2 [Saccoglossus kowalevskii]
MTYLCYLVSVLGVLVWCHVHALEVHFVEVDGDDADLEERRRNDMWNSLPDVLKELHPPPSGRQFDSNGAADPQPAMGHIIYENKEILGNEETEELLFEGDIYLGPARQRNAIIYKTRLWQNGIVPYEIDSSFDSSSVASINAAIAEYHKHTCIRFVQRSSQQDYLAIYPGNGCWSSIGRDGGRQALSLGYGCTFNKVTPMHEFMHAVGFAHEQSRTDRDSYVYLISQNIQRGMEYNFEKYGTDYIDDLGSSYDYHSIMHYHHTAFTINGESTILPTRAGVKPEDLGSSPQFTSTDIFKLNRLYNCDGDDGDEGDGNEGGNTWRDDLRCGSNYPLSSGALSQCDPNGIYPCCSTGDWCGNTHAHCECPGCVDYRDNGGEDGNEGDKKWRDDLRCGSNYPLSDGSPSECDPTGIYPCCSTADWCGNTYAHCECSGCVDYSGNGDVKQWRDDLRCGSNYPLSSGAPSQCDPNGIYPCCSTADWCGNTYAHCQCHGCVDYTAK